MLDDPKMVEKIVLTRLVRLNKSIMGITFGIIFGLVIFFATIILVVKGGPVVGPHLSLLGQYFIGYRVSIAGSFIGFAYGLLTGFMIGYFLSWAYNGLADLKEKVSKNRA